MKDSESFRTTTRTAPTGETVKIRWFYDQGMDAPWDAHDGHGIVSGWRCGRDKSPGELVLCNDGRNRRFYDFKATLEKARREGWGLHDDSKADLAKKLGRAPTSREIIAESVRLDFKYLKRWCDSDWFWCGYVVSVDGEERNCPDPMASSLWGIDSDSVAEFEDEAFEVVFSDLSDEAQNAHDAACRDIETLAA